MFFTKSQRTTKRVAHCGTCSNIQTDSLDTMHNQYILRVRTLYVISEFVRTLLAYHTDKEVWHQCSIAERISKNRSKIILNDETCRSITVEALQIFQPTFKSRPLIPITTPNTFSVHLLHCMVLAYHIDNEV